MCLIILNVGESRSQRVDAFEVNSELIQEIIEAAPCVEWRLLNSHLEMDGAAKKTGAA